MWIVTALFKPFAYVSVPYLILKYATDTNPTARYCFRVVAYYSALGFCSVWGMIVAAGMSLAGHRFDINWVVARSFYTLAGKLLDIKFVVEGEEHLDTRPAVLVGNHQSGLDILFLGRIFPKHASIMAKKELAWAPLLGGYLSASGAVFVDRGNNTAAVQSLKAAGDFMKKNTTSLWLFPEGTRSMRKHHDLLPFKKGAFHTAIQAGVPVTPVVCENYWRLYHKGHFEGGVLKIRVLPPISTTGLTVADVGDLATRTREQMLEALRDISEPLDSQPQPPPKKDTVSVPQTGDIREQTPTPNLPSIDTTPVEHSRESDTEAEPSTPSVSSSRRGGSENGVETEEDEGMVLVGRPDQK
ncbi:1-acylglycerol-3-phosphate O [Thelephora ganbajun]|uniref:1-acylglycerol-3-phosphate O n=1 Tax=Thelephora ganbajun TaxID=370292 RepID=A0ACB6Z4I1_THEGA|nr:1-acylglycerol-3-phosphate O [Thelephora ganbajun]